MEIMAFPSCDDLTALRRKIKAAKFDWDAMTTTELYHYHAYVYGGNAVLLGEVVNALDPDRAWFDKKLFAKAKAFYAERHQHRQSSQPPPVDVRDQPWFSQLTPALQQHIVDQNFARRDAMREIEREGSPDSHSVAKIAFVELCSRQHQANIAIFNRRNAAATADYSSERHKEILDRQKRAQEVRR